MLAGMDGNPQELYPAEVERSFRLMFILMYVGLISAVVYFFLVSQCSTLTLFGDTTLLVLMLLALLGIERFEQQRNAPRLRRRARFLLLLARVILVEAVVVLDCSSIGLLLYPVIPFTAYFSFRPIAGTLLTIFYFSFNLTRLWLLDPAWYQNQIILTVFLVFVLLLAFMQIMARVIDEDERRQRRTERLLTDLEESHQQLQIYAAQVAELAATAERNRLARDIHDSLGHYLTAINVQLEKALAFRQRNPLEADRAVHEARQSAREALRDVRRSVAALREAGDEFSLRAELGELVRGVENGRFHVHLQVRGDEAGYARPVLLTLYRAAQEGLTNVQKHAAATEVALDLNFGAEEARLVLQDDGRGFAPAALDDLAAAADHSFGLQGIRERVELVRGEMRVESEPGRGTELVITVPRQPMVLGQKREY